MVLQVKETTMIVVEYPRRLARLVRDSVGPLAKVRHVDCGQLGMPCSSCLLQSLFRLWSAVRGASCYSASVLTGIECHVEP